MAFIGFPDGNNIGSTVRVGGKTTVILYTYINHHAGTPGKTKTKDTMSLGTAQFVTLGLGSDGCQHYYITILLAIKEMID